VLPLLGGLPWQKVQSFKTHSLLFFAHFVILDDGSTPNDISQAVSPAFTAAFLWGHAHIFTVVPMLG
jgi:hypothetical protein